MCYICVLQMLLLLSPNYVEMLFLRIYLEDQSFLIACSLLLLKKMHWNVAERGQGQGTASEAAPQHGRPSAAERHVTDWRTAVAQHVRLAVSAPLSAAASGARRQRRLLSRPVDPRGAAALNGSPPRPHSSADDVRSAHFPLISAGTDGFRREPRRNRAAPEAAVAHTAPEIAVAPRRRSGSWAEK